MCDDFNFWIRLVITELFLFILGLTSSWALKLYLSCQLLKSAEPADIGVHSCNVGINHCASRR